MVKGLNAGSKTKGEPLPKNHFLFLLGLGGGGMRGINRQCNTMTEKFIE